MTQQEEHIETAEAIDRFLASPEFETTIRTDEHKYPAWYASALSAAALLCVGDEVQYAQGSFRGSTGEIRIVIFTVSRVIVLDTTTDFDGDPLARAVSRATLSSMKLSAAERIDARYRRSFGWPGNVYLILEYPGLDGPIEIQEHGGHRYSTTTTSPVVSLIHSLTKDLGRE